ncbi:MAG: hypothetical protein FJ119_05465 [Deltaproteobacteria bacterium]|nr:hypothetical protein [Deltaproteobacteria bacterium]
MLNRYSILCFTAGASLLTAKLAAVAANPMSASAVFFPNFTVIVVVFALLWAGLRARSTPGESPGLRKRALLLAAAGWVMTGFILTIAWVDHNLAQRTNASVYNEHHKVWATRGLVTDGSDGAPVRVRNSIDSIAYAFERSARGTELDVHYDMEMDDFVVSHPRRYEKPNGTLLTLGALFDAVGGDGYFWLDWKDLRHLNRSQLQAALARLKQITDRPGFMNRVYVEGEAPFSLVAVRQAGFQTIYDCRPLLDSNMLAPVVVDVFKAVYYFGGFTAMGLNSGTREEPIYGPGTRIQLRNIPLFVYHVPDDPEFLEDLASSRNVRVIIIRQDIDRFDFLPGTWAGFLPAAVPVTRVGWITAISAGESQMHSFFT